MAIQAFASLSRKLPVLATAVLANRLARMVWTIATKKEFYGFPPSA